MSREDWYRNTHWDKATEEAFRAKLSRSRSSRPQYLRIQASYLVDQFPSAALKLIDEYFETGDEFDVPNALCAQADARRSLGDVDGAVAAYKRALDWEIAHPNHISTARVDFPFLVAVERITREYDPAMDILTTRFKPMDHQFPTTRYFWNGSCALISDALGHHDDARDFAERALRAAAETESPFRHHRSVGVVRDISDDFGQRIKRIARPSMLRSLLRLI